MTPTKSATKYALIFGVMLALLLIVKDIIFYKTGLMESGTTFYDFIYYFVYPFICFFFVFAFKKINDSFLTLEQALIIGFGVGALSGLLYAIFQFLLLNVFDPELTQRIMEKSLENNNLTIEQREQAREMMSTKGSEILSYASYFIFFGFNIFFGFLYSLISGLILKRKRPAHI